MLNFIAHSYLKLVLCNKIFLLVLYIENYSLCKEVYSDLINCKMKVVSLIFSILLLINLTQSFFSFEQCLTRGAACSLPTATT